MKLTDKEKAKLNKRFDVLMRKVTKTRDLETMWKIEREINSINDKFLADLATKY